MSDILSNLHSISLSSIFSQQSAIAESLDQSSIDRTTAVYSWKDWVAMVIKYKYQTLQTSIDPSFQ